MSLLSSDRASSWVVEETQMLVTLPSIEAGPLCEKKIIPITRVYSQWRNIVLNTGACWRVLNLHTPKAAAVFARRSNNGNLRLYVNELVHRRKAPLSTSQVALCRKDASQLSSIELNSSLSGLRKHAAIFQECPLPRLQRLKLLHESLSTIRIESPLITEGPSRAPLRSVELCNVAIDWTSPIYRDLMSLTLTSKGRTIEISVDQLLDILTQCPRLRKLSISGLEIETHSRST
ncbi:hypothetical protein K474DRAFT_320813 [Panus rudis PR-1116 ss-1]|nr:hypothetical protein K474DRAFT_320813 [Panus rudis PR-1116 ss-1]